MNFFNHCPQLTWLGALSRYGFKSKTIWIHLAFYRDKSSS